MTWWSAVLPIVTLVLGYVGTLVTEDRRDQRATTRERELRIEDERRGRLLKRDDFELNTLLRAHTALGDVGRAAGRVMHFDTMSGRSTGVYAGTQLTTELSDRLFQEDRALHDVTGLILDDAIRLAVEDVHMGLTRATNNIRAPLEQGELVTLAAIAQVGAAQDLVSERIRAVYRSR